MERFQPEKLRFQYSEQPSALQIHTGETPYLSFRALDETGLVKNAFSTRFGGVSEGYLSSLNFSYTKEGESAEAVTENYKRMAGALDVDSRRMVVSWQTATTNVRVVTKRDEGKGIFRERDYRDIDGLICNVPGITLVTLYADCVPLYFLDPVQKAIGLSHSGWRGTVLGMGKETIRAMDTAYGCDPSDLICCIGPSICKDCFEVGGEVAAAFLKSFGAEDASRIIYRAVHADGKEPVSRADIMHLAVTGLGSLHEEKYYIDLWEANRIVLQRAGVPAEHIFTAGLCTKCNSDQMWSHRASGNRRGNLAAFLTLI